MPIRQFFRLLRQAPIMQVLSLLALMVLAGLSEGVGLLLLVPLLEILQGGAGWRRGVNPITPPCCLPMSVGSGSG